MNSAVHWGQLTALDEHNETYEPNQECMSSAINRGLQLPKHNRYLYLAREGLKAPLPPFWQACEDAQGNLYFRNRKTRKIVQENPLDDLYRQKAQQLIRLEKIQYVQTINEVSAVNQSSGLLQSKMQSSAQINGKQNQENQSLVQPRQLKNHITQQSQYSESEQSVMIKSQLERTESKLQNNGNNKNFVDLKKKIDRFVPQRKHLINSIQIWDQSLRDVIDYQKMQHLVNLRLQVQRKKQILKQLSQQKKRLRSLCSEATLNSKFSIF